jgi:hypothetical protein
MPSPTARAEARAVRFADTSPMKRSLAAQLAAVALMLLTVPSCGPLEAIPVDQREGPADVMDNDHDDYPHDCLVGDLCTPFPMP